MFLLIGPFCKDVNNYLHQHRFTKAFTISLTTLTYFLDTFLGIKIFCHKCDKSLSSLLINVSLDWSILLPLSHRCQPLSLSVQIYTIIYIIKCLLQILKYCLDNFINIMMFCTMRVSKCFNILNFSSFHIP